MLLNFMPGPIGKGPSRTAPAVGVGCYTLPEAARLLRISPRAVRRWMAGYSYREAGESHDVPPLWSSQLPAIDDEIEIGFRDLIELRFVAAFTKAGLGLKTIRHCLSFAAECVDDQRPFSTQRFQTDGRTLFLESIRRAGGDELLDLKKKQYVFRKVVEQSFKDLDIEDGVVRRWRPLAGRSSIVLDPTRAFGQPIADAYGVTTVALKDAAEAEGSIARAAWVFEVPVGIVRDAVRFEQHLEAA